MRCFLSLLLGIFTGASCWAQVPRAAVAATVPPLIKVSGTLANAQGTVGVNFALYAEQTDGAPLWLETQNVIPDANGRYTIYLGANHANGVPLDLFASGEARWLGVQPEGQAEQARVQLVSVPYAMTAGDAQTLADSRFRPLCWPLWRLEARRLAARRRRMPVVAALCRWTRRRARQRGT